MGLWAYWLEPGAWSVELPVVLPVLLSGWLYWSGRRRTAPAGGGGGRRGRGWRPAAFYAGLAVLLLALESPIDLLSQSLFWMHMIQHMLLLLVAAPLLVAGAPWLPVWQGLPGPVRRWLGPRAAPFLQSGLGRRLGRAATAPLVGLGLFAGDLWAWHLPVLFDLTLRNELVHHVEHISFVGVGLLYWATVIDSPPLVPRLAAPARIGALFGGILACWVLAILLAIAPGPLYAPYARLADRPGGGSALADQRLGAGIMWAPSMIPFDIMLTVLVRQWLADEDRRGAALNAARLASGPPERGVRGGRLAEPGGGGPGA